MLQMGSENWAAAFEQAFQFTFLVFGISVLSSKWMTTS